MTMREQLVKCFLFSFPLPVVKLTGNTQGGGMYVSVICEVNIIRLSRASPKIVIPLACVYASLKSDST